MMLMPMLKRFPTKKITRNTRIPTGLGRPSPGRVAKILNTWEITEVASIRAIKRQ